MTYEERLEFFDRNKPLVIKLLYENGVRDEDHKQEVFLKYWKSIEKYNPELGKESTFVFTVVRNQLLNLKLDYFRHEGRDNYYCLSSSTPMNEDEDIILEDTLVYDEDDIADMLLFSDFYRELNNILVKLYKDPLSMAKARDMYIRRTIDNETLRSIGEHHGVSKQRVSQIITRINTHMKARLKEWVM